MISPKYAEYLLAFVQAYSGRVFTEAEFGQEYAIWIKNKHDEFMASHPDLVKLSPEYQKTFKVWLAQAPTI